MQCDSLRKSRPQAAVILASRSTFRRAGKSFSLAGREGVLPTTEQKLRKVSKNISVADFVPEFVKRGMRGFPQRPLSGALPSKFPWEALV